MPPRNPEHPRGGDGINGPSLPPGDLVAEAMDVTVMGSAKRHREFVADFAPHRARLSELQMVCVCGTSRADQARLRSYEFEVDFVAEPARLTDRKYALVDLGESAVGLNVCCSRRDIIGDHL